MPNNQSTIRYTSERPSTALTMARVMAAGRITDAARKEREAREKYAYDLLETLRLGGAVKIGLKICDDEGKYRYSMDIAGEDYFPANEPLLLLSIGSTYRADAEIWGVKVDGSYCESVF